MKTHRRFLGLRVSALIEIAIFFVIMFLINNLSGASPRFINTSPHPYWIIVLVISAMYGSMEGLVAVFVASLALLLFNVPEQGVNQDLYAWLYDISINPIMWLVGAVIIGEIAQRHLRRLSETREELEDSREREATFAKYYEQAKSRKEKLELNIAGQLRTETAAYRAAKAIEKLHPDDVIDGVNDLVTSVMGCEKFSLYMLDGDVLRRRTNSGWDISDTETMHEEFRSHTQLYQSIIGRRELLSVVNEEHERILAGEGVIAGPLVDPDSKAVLGMLKIEHMPFTELNLNTVETFRAICEWITLAFINAEHYQTAVEGSTVNPEHNLMTRSFFNRYKDYISALAQRLKFNVYSLNISIANHAALDANTRITVAKMLSQTVQNTLRSVDFAFDYQQNSGSYAIILPATDAKGADVVRRKIEKELLGASAKQARDAQFAFSLSPIHEV
jgi:polysaccharide biosynthesis protein PelD